MTFEQIEKMTEAERNRLIESYQKFDASQDLEAYTSSIKDYILVWRRFVEGRTSYTQEMVENTVNSQSTQIKTFYDEQTCVEDAAIDVDFCCG